ncbi:MAG: DJ-1 family protein [Armatimonadetes bacterium]|nr:DJ-1 family protein [Armatimonadota bacterium]
MPDVAGRSVLMVVPPGRFKDEELDIPKRMLERNKVKVDVGALAIKQSFGLGGAIAKPSVTLESAEVSQYDAIVFVGGIGTRDLWDNEHAHSLARRAVDAGKIVAALSTAPVILARAGLLEGKEATVLFSETRQLTEKGAKYTGNPITVDGRIITVKGPEAAEKFGMSLIKMIVEAAATPQ